MEALFGKLLAYEHELIQHRRNCTPQRKITRIVPVVRKMQRISI